MNTEDATLKFQHVGLQDRPIFVKCSDFIVYPPTVSNFKDMKICCQQGFSHLSHSNFLSLYSVCVLFRPKCKNSQSMCGVGTSVNFNIHLRSFTIGLHIYSQIYYHHIHLPSDDIHKSFTANINFSQHSPSSKS